MLLLNQTRRTAQAAFTLIELLAVVLIIGILATFLLPKIPEVIDGANVTACKSNLNEVGKGMLLHKAKYGGLPKAGGVKFFASLISREVWEAEETSTKKLTCPGVELSSLEPSIENIEMKQWYTELDRLNGAWSSYAGRDTKRHPIRKIDGSQILVADDNDGGSNHRTQTNALFGDWSVRQFDIVIEREAGRATKEDPFVVVGADAWLEDLRKLSLD